VRGRPAICETCDWCRKFNIKFKLDTVVNNLNFEKDMRFMDKGSGKLVESESILDVGVEKALS